MWYMPYIRVRRAVTIYTICACALTLITLTIRFWPGLIPHGSPAQKAQLADFHVDVAFLLSIGAGVVGGFATVLGLNLAAENENHLELAWTKPVSREGYALGIFAVDLIAMIACIVVTAVCAGVLLDLSIGRQAVEIGDAESMLRAIAYFGFPLSVYAWITALSASLKRDRGVVAGLFWPVLLVIAVLAAVPVPAVHAIANALGALSPVTIYAPNSHAPEASIAALFWGWALAALLLAAALAQWRRIEI